MSSRLPFPASIAITLSFFAWRGIGRSNRHAGAKIRITTKRGETVSTVEISDTLRPGHISLPNGQGLSYPGADPEIDLGVAPNEITSGEDRDWFAGTPHHKHVRARLEKV